MMASLAVGALSGGMGILSAVAWRRTLKTTNFWRLTHSRCLFLCIIIWSIWKVVTALISALTKTSAFQVTGMGLAENLGQATLFVICYTAYLGCWADVHIHGHVQHDAYRYSKAPWIIFYTTATGALVSGTMAMFANVITFVPPYRTLEVWTSVMCGLLVVTSIGLAIFLWQAYPPEESRAKRISLNIQNAVLLFVCICFILRARMSWISTSYLGVSSFQQMTRFIYLAAEWLAVGVMLIFTFPRSFTGPMVLPSSEVVRVQWKHAKIANGVATLVGLICSVVGAFVTGLLEHKGGSKYDLYVVLDSTSAVLTFLSALTCGGLFVACLLKNRESVRPLVVVLISIAALEGGYSFASVICLLIGVPPFNVPSVALIVTTACCTANVLVIFVVCSITYRLSSYVKDSSSFDIFMDSVVLDENFETPNKELEDKARTIQKFLIASLILHASWICVYFIPATSSALKSTLSYGWIVTLITLIFVIARFPLALFGYVSSLVYRRDSNRLRGYVITQAALNVFGLAIVGLQSYFWLCEGGHCAANPNPHPLTNAQKACFMISSILVLLLIFEFVINLLYYQWFKKVRQRLSSLILEDINHKVDAMF
jgi:hypothetical protein